MKRKGLKKNTNDYILANNIECKLTLYRDMNSKTIKNQVLKSASYQYHANIRFVDTFSNPWDEDINFDDSSAEEIERTLSLLQGFLSKKMSKKELNRHREESRDTLEIYLDSQKGWGIKSAKALPANLYIGIYPGDLVFHPPYENFPVIISKDLQIILEEKKQSILSKKVKYPFCWSNALFMSLAYSYSFSSESQSACVHSFKQGPEHKALEHFIKTLKHSNQLIDYYEKALIYFLENTVGIQTWVESFCKPIPINETGKNLVKQVSHRLSKFKFLYYRTLSIVSYSKINELVLINTSSDKNRFNITAETVLLEGKPLICMKTSRLITLGEELLADYGESYSNDKAMQHFMLGIRKKQPHCFS